MRLCDTPLLQDEDLLVQYYPYLRGSKDIYSCADEHRVGRICLHVHSAVGQTPAWMGRESASAAPAVQSPMAAGL